MNTRSNVLHILKRAYQRKQNLYHLTLLIIASFMRQDIIIWKQENCRRFLSGKQIIKKDILSRIQTNYF